ncbi:MAG: hypothetical protein LUH63_07170 [Parabacteroides sp.]|nr:hypothetical protein [Parabacteroides sp.]
MMLIVFMQIWLLLVDLKIESGGISSSKYTTGLSNNKFFLYSTGSSGFLGFSATNVWAGIGLNVLPETLGGTRALLRLENNVASSYDTNYGALIEARNGAKNRALECVGGFRVKGAVALARLIGAISNGGYTNDIINGIGYKDTFVYQPPSPLNVDLPTPAQIQSGFGQIYNDYNGDWINTQNGSYIEITILVTRWAASYIRIRGNSAANLIDQNGNASNAGTYTYGALDLNKGNSVKLGYFNSSWYIVSLYR